jgi:hypothetical protein
VQLEILNASTNTNAGSLYLELMKACLTNTIYGDPNARHGFPYRPYESALRAEGRDWPSCAHTMIGGKRLNNLQFCVEDVLRRGVPGDLIETGVWRGGAVIFMRAILKVHGVKDRHVWVADSFEGVPPSNLEKYPEDTVSLDQFRQLAVPLTEVENNFRTYGLLDDQVHFLKGWFRDTLPSAPIEKLAVLRLDGDLYESTMDALRALYPKLQKGGYVIVDDFGAMKPCRQAIEEFRNTHGIKDKIEQIDWTGVYWQKGEA